MIHDSTVQVFYFSGFFLTYYGRMPRMGGNVIEIAIR